MKAQIKDMWLEALVGGGYKQGKAALRTEDGKFCCLGVLCDLYGKEKGLKKPWREGGRFSNSNNYSTLPTTVSGWAGLRDYNPSVKDKNGIISSLAELNDGKAPGQLGKGYSFKEIARIIETQL